MGNSIIVASAPNFYVSQFFTAFDAVAAAAAAALVLFVSLYLTIDSARC